MVYWLQLSVYRNVFVDLHSFKVVEHFANENATPGTFIPSIVPEICTFT